MRQVLILLAIAGLVSGCGTIGNITGSSAGSANSAGSAGSAGSARSSGSGSSAGLFGGQRTTQQVVVDQRTADAGGRVLIATLKDARFERTRDGGIIRATGIAPRQGYYDAVLFSPTDLYPDENGDIILEFRAKEPQFNTAVSTDWSRTISVGVFLSSERLASARRVVVVGRTKQIQIRRR